MDEEHGRPGLLAGINGQFDALKDALPKSLRLAAPRVPHPGSAWVGGHDPDTTRPNTHTAYFREEGRGSSPGMALTPRAPMPCHPAPEQREGEGSAVVSVSPRENLLPTPTGLLLVPHLNAPFKNQQSRAARNGAEGALSRTAGA